MKIKIFTLIALLSMPFHLVSADIAADFKAGLTIAQIMDNALAGGQSIDEAVGEMVAEKPEMAGIITRTAINKSRKDAAKIVTAATASAPRQRDAIRVAAISAGADPTTVTRATAAGIATSTIRAIPQVQRTVAAVPAIPASPN